jgi:hypothetical protein
MALQYLLMLLERLVYDIIEEVILNMVLAPRNCNYRSRDDRKLVSIMSDIILQEPSMKQCTGPCQQWFPDIPEFFHRNGKMGLRPDCKACRNARKQISRDLPGERAKASARTKEWDKAHKEYRSQYNKTYREAHRDHFIEYERYYYQSHKEQKSKYVRTYRRNHPLQYRLANQKRRVRLKAIPGTLNHEQIHEKLKKQRYTCYYCHNKFKRIKGKYIFQLDHTIPVSRIEERPRHDVNFVVLSCPTCNDKKKAKLPHEWPEGGRLL